MNLRGLMLKLQTAIMQRGKLIKINTRQCYSENKDKIITKYILTTPTIRKDKNGKSKRKDENIFESYSIPEIIKYLSEEYKKLGDASG